MKRFIPLCILTLFPLPAIGAPELTLYSNGNAFVREIRTISLTQREEQVKLDRFPPRIIPSSIVATPLTSGVSVVRQRFDPPPTPANLVEQYRGKVVTIVDENPRTGEEKRIPARIVSTAGGTVYQVGDDLMINPPGRILFPVPPDRVFNHPTLTVTLRSDQSKSFPLQLQWLTSGITWRADYRLMLEEKSDRARLDAVVTIENQSGIPFDRGLLSLVAGDPNSASPPPRLLKAAAQEGGHMSETASPEPVGDFHLYRIPEPVSLGEGGIEQIPLFPPIPVGITRQYRVEPPPFYPGIGSPRTIPVSSVVEFTNSPPSGPGSPLPRGIVRLYGTDQSGRPLFLGEDTIDHTPEGERIRITVGRAMDIVAERTETAVKRISPDTRELSFQTTIRNHRPEPVTVSIAEPLTGESILVSSSVPPSRRTARLLEFLLPIPPSGSATLSVTIQSRP